MSNKTVIQFARSPKAVRDFFKKKKNIFESNHEKKIEDLNKFKDFILKESTRQISIHNKTIEDKKNKSLTKLEKDHKDYKIIQKLLHLEDFKVRYKDIKVKAKTYNYQIFKICAKKTDDSGSKKIVLLHGTKLNLVESIIKSGLKASKTGVYGAGVYLTNGYDYAADYGVQNYIKNNEMQGVISIILTNISEENMRKVEGENKRFNKMKLADLEKLQQKEYNDEEPGHKIVFNDLARSHKDDYPIGLVRGGAFVGDRLKMSIILSHETLVDLAYIVKIEMKYSSSEVARQIILKSCTKVFNSGKSFSSEQYRKHEIAETKIDEELNNNLKHACPSNVQKVVVEKLKKYVKEKEKSLTEKFKATEKQAYEEIVFDAKKLIEGQKASSLYSLHQLLDNQKDFIFASNIVLMRWNHMKKLFKSEKIKVNSVYSVLHENEQAKSLPLILYSCRGSEVFSIVKNGFEKKDVISTNDFKKKDLFHCQYNGNVVKYQYVILTGLEVNFKPVNEHIASMLKPKRPYDTNKCFYFSKLWTFDSKQITLKPVYLVIIEHM